MSKILNKNLPIDILLNCLNNTCDVNELLSILERVQSKNINKKKALSGRTALILASRRGYYYLIEALLKRKNIDINIRDSTGATALIWATSRGYVNIVKLLLGNGNTDINIRTIFNTTAIDIATYNGYTEIIKLLKNYQKIDL